MPTALVTGASSGIGAALARALARRDHDLILSARREAPMRDLAQELGSRHAVRVHVVPADLAVADGARALLERIAALELDVDVLVNNAGFANFGSFTEIPAEDELALVRVNVEAPTVLAKALLPSMLRRGEGGVLNVASLAAFVPGPGMATYYASKAYLLHLSEALTVEVRGSGVRVTALCPGPTRSGFQERARIGGSRLERLGDRVMHDAERVAEEGVRAFERGQRVYVPGAMNRLGTMLPRFVPRRVTARAVARVHAPDPERGTGG